MLRAAGVDWLMVGCVGTAWALQAAVREGHDRYRLVLEKSCAAATREELERSIEQISRLARVVRSADLAVPAEPTARCRLPPARGRPRVKTPA